MSTATGEATETTTEERRKPYHHGDLRRAIISSSVRRVRQQGERAIVLREIAAEIGVSATAAYRHFANRAELVEIVAIRGFEEMAEGMRTAPVLDAGVAAESSSERAGLAAWADVRNACRAYVKFAADEAEWTRMMLETAGEVPAVLEAYRQVGQAVSRAAERGVASGVFRDGVDIFDELEFWTAVQGMVLGSALGLIAPNDPSQKVWKALDNLLDKLAMPALLTETGQELVAKQKPFPDGALSDLTDWL